MPWQPKIRVALVKCGRCGKSYRGPGHTCVTRMGRKPGRTKVKPQASASLIKCGKCGKAYANPLTHTCTVKTDFKARTAKAKADAKRQAAEAKRAARKAARGEHEPEDCTDDDCPRFGCRMYKRGYLAGDAAGFRRGYKAGYVDGYAKGFPDGIAACPRPHK